MIMVCFILFENIYRWGYKKGTVMIHRVIVCLVICFGVLTNMSVAVAQNKKLMNKNSVNKKDLAKKDLVNVDYDFTYKKDDDKQLQWGTVAFYFKQEPIVNKLPQRESTGKEVFFFPQADVSASMYTKV